MKVNKVWGTEIYLASEPEYTGKLLCITPGFQCSLHKHDIKKETFYVLHGIVRLERHTLDGIFFETMLEGDARTILPGTYHRFSSTTGATIVEISTQHSDADVTRLEESCLLNSSPVQSTPYITTLSSLN